jgi:hypothetical protein
MFGGDFLVGYPHAISGEVVKEPSTRYVRNESGGDEKVSLTLKVDPMQIGGTLEVGFAPSTHQLTVECLSTRCAQIEKGEKHELTCRGVGRMLEPNVVVCKHSRAL